jgi:hypothetical protein
VPAHDEIELATNGMLDAGRDVPAPEENGRPPNGVPRAGRAAAGTRRAPAPVIWPDDQDEQDEPPRPGRHRRD